MLEQVFALNKMITYGAIFFSSVALIFLWLAKRSLNKLTGLEEDSTFSLKRNHLVLKEKMMVMKKELAAEKKKQKLLHAEHQSALKDVTALKKTLLKAGVDIDFPDDTESPSPQDEMKSGKKGKKTGSTKAASAKKMVIPQKKKIIKRPEESGILGETQLFQFNELLAPGPKGNVDLVSILDNDNSFVLAGQINDILLNNGWTTNGVTQRFFPTPPDGILISVHSKETAPTYAVFLQRIFEIIGIQTTGSLSRKIQEWSVTMVIGNIRTK